MPPSPGFSEKLMTNNYQNTPKSQTKIPSPMAKDRDVPSLQVLPEAGGFPPCLYSNNSIEYPKDVAILDLAKSVLSPYYKRAAATLAANVLRLSKESKGISHLAFVTLTFKRNVRDHLEASRCFNSFNSNSFSKNPDYGTYINTKELQDARGVWHYHLIVEVKEDILTGFDFPAFREWLVGNNRFKSPCPTGSPYFLRLWKELGEDVQRYGFGKICSIEPIQSNEEAIARYIGGYIGKTIHRRTKQEKGVRLVNYPKGWVRNSPKFSWNTSNAAEWRRKMAIFAKYQGCDEMYQLSAKLGPGWVYKNFETIMKIDEIYLEHRMDDWKYVPGGDRIHQETGEYQTKEQQQYRDIIFKAIQDNQKQKRELLRAEALGICKTNNHTEVQRKKKQKEKSKKVVEDAKTEHLAFYSWLKKLPPAPF